jgi:hypothetical protein
MNWTRLETWLERMVGGVRDGIKGLRQSRQERFDPCAPEWLRDELARAVQTARIPILNVAPTRYQILLSRPDWEEAERLYGVAVLTDDLTLYLEHVLRELGCAGYAGAYVCLVPTDALPVGSLEIRLLAETDAAEGEQTQVRPRRPGEETWVKEETTQPIPDGTPTYVVEA